MTNQHNKAFLKHRDFIWWDPHCGLVSCMAFISWLWTSWVLGGPGHQAKPSPQMTTWISYIPIGIPFSSVTQGPFCLKIHTCICYLRVWIAMRWPCRSWGWKGVGQSQSPPKLKVGESGQETELSVRRSQAGGRTQHATLVLKTQVL